MDIHAAAAVIRQAVNPYGLKNALESLSASYTSQYVPPASNDSLLP